MKISRLIPCTSLLLATVLAPAAQAQAQEAPDPDRVRITDVSYRGSGCHQDSVTWVLSPGAQALSVLFSDFTAEDFPDTPPASRRKKCRVTVELAYPPGWQYAIYRVDYRGGAYLDEGTWGRQQARLHLRGAGAVPSHMRIEGPHAGNYLVSSSIEPNARAWSQCRPTGTLTIDASIHVHARQGRSALMTVDSIDGVVEQTYDIEWRRCAR